MRIIIYFLMISFLCSCATPTMKIPRIHPKQIEKARKSLVSSSKEYNRKQFDNLYNINYNITKNASIKLCDKKLQPTLGFDISQINLPRKQYFFDFWLFKEKATLKTDLRELNKGKNKHYKVYALAKNSNAYKAGVRVGDRVISIYGKRLPNRKDGIKKAYKQIKKSSKGKSMTWLEIERNNKIIDIEYENDYVCPYDVYIDPTRDLNAYATGDEIIVTKGMLEELKNEPEKLAFIIGHELSHNTLGHAHSKRKNETIGMLLGLLLDTYNDEEIISAESNTYKIGVAGKSLFSQDFEKEADYLGTYYIARAGYDYHKAKDTWKMMTIHNPSSLYIATSHPTSGERYTIIDKTAEEIDNKKTFEMEITPNWLKRNDYMKNKNKGFFYW